MEIMWMINLKSNRYLNEVVEIFWEWIIIKKTALMKYIIFIFDKCETTKVIIQHYVGILGKLSSNFDLWGII